MTFALVLAALTVVYGTAINLRPLSDRAYVACNVLAGAAVVAATLTFTGSAAGDLGLAAPDLSEVAGAGAALVVAAAAVPALVRLGRRSPRVARWLSDERIEGTTSADVAQRALVRIPVGTAAFEEVAFRGALLTAFAEVLPLPVAVAASSAAFGLWHVVPTWQLLRANGVRRRGVPIAMAVVGTGVAGAGLCVLRVLSGGLLVPWAVHTAVNVAGSVAASLHRRQEHDR